jgi:hypothetical protein
MMKIDYEKYNNFVPNNLSIVFYFRLRVKRWNKSITFRLWKLISLEYNKLGYHYN